MHARMRLAVRSKFVHRTSALFLRMRVPRAYATRQHDVIAEGSLMHDHDATYVAVGARKSSYSWVQPKKGSHYVILQYLRSAFWVAPTSL